MSNAGYRAVIKFFTRKGLNATEMTRELADIYGDSAPLYHSVAKRIADFKNPIRGFEDAPRSGRSTTPATD